MIKFEGDKLEMAGTVGKLAGEQEKVFRGVYPVLVKKKDQENLREAVSDLCYTGT